MRPDTRGSYSERILRVLLHIQTHLDETLSLDDLARLAFFSPYHFHRIFRGMVGESVMEHIRRLRLERAAHRLQQTDDLVTLIAFDAGYETHEAFTRAFRAMFGQSPSGFRETRATARLSTARSAIHYGSGIDRFQTAEGDFTMDVRIEQVQPMRVAFIRQIGPYQQAPATWGKLMAWAGPRGLLGPDTLYIGISHDDPSVTPPDKLRYDACIPVGPDVQAEGEVGVQEIAGGEYALTTHHGPYMKLDKTYAELCGQWLPGSGREPGSGPCFEIYRNWQDMPPEDDLLTDVYLPLQPK
jgi:AraC family transcriptional regulator